MKVSQLKNLIKEAVKEAIQEELGSMQSQAAPVQEVKAPTPPPPPPAPKRTGNSLLDAINETKYSMSSEDYKTIVSANSSMVQAPGMGMQSQAMPSGPQPGLDLSQLDFAKKAGAIFQKSNELDKAKHGL